MPQEHAERSRNDPSGLCRRRPAEKASGSSRSRRRGSPIRTDCTLRQIAKARETMLTAARNGSRNFLSWTVRVSRGKRCITPPDARAAAGGVGEAVRHWLTARGELHCGFGSIEIGPNRMGLHVHQLVMCRPLYVRAVRDVIARRWAVELGCERLDDYALRWAEPPPGVERPRGVVPLAAAMKQLDYLLAVLVDEGQTIAGIKGKAGPRVAGRRFLSTPLTAVTRLPRPRGSAAQSAPRPHRQERRLA
jgi:hypothetical protein